MTKRLKDRIGDLIYGLDPKELWRRYVVALGLIVVLVCVSHSAAVLSTRVMEEEAVAINVSGRQRMLSQRIIVFAQQMRQSDGAERELWHDRLAGAINLFERSHDALLYGSKEMELLDELPESLRPHYFGANGAPGLDAAVQDYIADARTVLDGEGAEATAAWDRLVRAGTGGFLTDLDEAVLLFEHEARRSSTAIRRVESWSFAAALFVLAVEALLIFMPAHLGARRAFSKLEARNRRLGEAHQELRALYDMAETARRGREAADAANDFKSKFLANMSHEIRTPLNGVLGMAQLLEQGDLTDEQKEKLQVIVESGKSLINILDDVLDMSKIEAGQLGIVPADGDLRQTLQRVHQLFAPAAAKKGLTFTLDIDPSVPQSLVFDPVRVRQCLSNLLSNALKFTADGRISIRATAAPLGDEAHQVAVEVTDTGIGISDEVQKRLFRPFTQADAKVAQSYGGTGLGLTITRELARLMGGDATVFSVSGQGSRFTFTFRAGATRSAETTGGAESGTDADISFIGINALVVDDNAINRRVARAFLESVNMVVTEAEGGEQALSLLADNHFDILLLDMNMPVMDGPDVMEHIRASGREWRNIPILALTADAMTGDRERYLSLGADGYVSKPISGNDLYAEIARALGRPSKTSTPHPRPRPRVSAG